MQAKLPLESFLLWSFGKYFRFWPLVCTSNAINLILFIINLLFIIVCLFHCSTQGPHSWTKAPLCCTNIEQKDSPSPESLQSQYQARHKKWVQTDICRSTKKQCNNIDQHARQWHHHSNSLTIVKCFVGLISKENFKEKFEGGQ